MTKSDDIPGPEAASPNDPESPPAEGGTRSHWEKPVLLPLDIDQSEGMFADVTDEDDFKTPS